MAQSGASLRRGECPLLGEQRRWLVRPEQRPSGCTARSTTQRLPPVALNEIIERGCAVSLGFHFSLQELII